MAAVGILQAAAESLGSTLICPRALAAHDPGVKPHHVGTLTVDYELSAGQGTVHAAYDVSAHLAQKQQQKLNPKLSASSWKLLRLCCDPTHASCWSDLLEPQHKCLVCAALAFHWHCSEPAGQS